jgi:hypothetical protein
MYCRRGGDRRARASSAVSRQLGGKSSSVTCAMPITLFLVPTANLFVEGARRVSLKCLGGLAQKIIKTIIG